MTGCSILVAAHCMAQLYNLQNTNPLNPIEYYFFINQILCHYNLAFFMENFSN